MGLSSAPSRLKSIALLVLGSLVVTLAFSPVAHAATTMRVTSPGPLNNAVDFITGVPGCGVGPVGMSFDGPTILVTDYCNSTTYKYDASSGTPVLVGGVANGLTHGIAIVNGVSFGVASNNQSIASAGVWMFSPTTLQLERQVAQDPCGDIRGLAADPTTGGLILSGDCGIFRIKGLDTLSPFLEPVTAGNFDGIAIDPSGNAVWAALNGDGLVNEYDLATGALLNSISVPGGPDGIAFAAPGSQGGIGGNIFVNVNNGTIVMIDVHSGNATSVVASGGGRGDFVAVGPDGFLYVTQPDSIVQIQPAMFVPPIFTPTPHGGALDPTAWSPGDVHVHSTGDASLRDNLLCRNTNPPLIPHNGNPTAEQERQCSAFLSQRVAAAAKAAGLQWTVLSEHGVWLGMNSPGNGGLNPKSYSATEAAAEWKIIKGVASTESVESGVRMLMGEEIGTAPPIGSSGHFSAYYTPDYVPDSPLLDSEGKFLQAVQAAGGWGAINHPFETGSDWGCWDSRDYQFSRGGTKTRCRDGVAAEYAGQVKGIEIYNGSYPVRPQTLLKWDGLLSRGLNVSAVAGGDTHTVARFGIKEGLKAARQHIGNTANLGTDLKARTYVMRSGLTPAAGYDSNIADDPVRTALLHGETLASNGPVAGVSIDGFGPTDTRSIPSATAGHVLAVRWDPANKVPGATSAYGDPTAVRVVVGQVVDPTYKADCGTPTDPYRDADCVRIVNVPLSVSTTGSNHQLTYKLPSDVFKTFSIPQSDSTVLQYTPKTFVRVEIDFAGGRGVYSSPFYLQGSATKIPKF